MFFDCVGFSYVVLDLVCSDYFAKEIGSQTVSKWCLCRGVSLHKDQLLQDPLTFKQNSSYELFWFFHYIFIFLFTVLVVHPHHDHPVTTVLTHSGTYSLVVSMKAGTSSLCPWRLVPEVCVHEGWYQQSVVGSWFRSENEKNWWTVRWWWWRKRWWYTCLVH